MKKEFIRCEFCKTEIPSEACKFAAYGKVIDGKEILFCCQQHAQRYLQKKKKTK